jgi:hypothetical protein
LEKLKNYITSKIKPLDGLDRTLSDLKNGMKNNGQSSDSSDLNAINSRLATLENDVSRIDPIEQKLRFIPNSQ